MGNIILEEIKHFIKIHNEVMKERNQNEIKAPDVLIQNDSTVTFTKEPLNQRKMWKLVTIYE